jgi:hypothetical protein
MHDLEVLRRPRPSDVPLLLREPQPQRLECCVEVLAEQGRLGRLVWL